MPLATNLARGRTIVDFAVRKFWPVVVGCLLLQALLAVDCARRWTPTHDEYWHLPIGLRIWKSGRLDDDVINPPPVRIWAALPLVVGGANPGDVDSRLDVGDIGDAFWRANGDRVRFWYLLGRLMIVPFATLTGLVIAIWTRSWYGERAALLSVLLWTCCPTALANAAIVTHDLPLAAAWTVTLLALVRFAERPSWRRALLFGAMLGLTPLMKLTGLLLAPLSVVLWFVLRGRVTVVAPPPTNSPVTTNSRATNIPPVTNHDSRSRLLLRWLAAFAVALTVINACFFFRGTGTALGSLKLNSPRLQGFQQTAAVLGALPVLLPRDFVAALDRLAQDLETRHPVYLDGQWSDRPFPLYYAAALLYKLPVSTLILVLFGLAAVARPRPETNDRRQGLFLLIAALLLPVLASGSSNQIGIRYVLPTIPLLCIFAGQSARWLEQLDVVSGTNGKRASKSTPTSPPSSSSTASRPALSRPTSSRWRTRLLWLTVIMAPLSLRHHPHHLAYFNPLAGGPAGGRFHLVDSNLDWGQDLHGLKDYLDQHHIPNVGLAYFGTVVPSSIGIESHVPPSRFPQPGWYAISANFVQGRPHVLRIAGGDRVPVGIEEFGYFRYFEPVATIGHSINVYRLTPGDVGRYAADLQALQRGSQ